MDVEGVEDINEVYYYSLNKRKWLFVPCNKGEIGKCQLVVFLNERKQDKSVK